MSNMMLPTGGCFLGGGIFAAMDNMRSMNHQMNQQRIMMPQRQMMMMVGSGGSSFQSSYTSISIGGGIGGQPQVYQSSSSTTVGPNGVRETKRTERDTRTGVQKIAIGHHIGDRAHIIEKSKNLRSGDNEESQEFINVEEDEADQFNQEFKQRINHHHHRSRHQPYCRPPIAYHSPHHPHSSSSRRHHS